MKRGLLLIVVLGGVASLIWAGVERYGFYKGTANPSTAAAISKPSVPPANPPALSPLVAVAEWQRYHNARQGALQANPALQSEYQDILQKMDAQQAADFAAIVKVNPKVAPVVAKLVALRAQHGTPITPPHPSAAGKVAQAPEGVTITPKEWQALRAARSLAMQVNPGLMLESEKLAERMQAWEAAVDAAMVKGDSGMAPLVARFGADRSETAQANGTVR
jgi:hypothetical protein